MSTKPKGVVVYSADELKHFYIKGNGLNTEMEIGFEQTSDSSGLPIFINNESIYIMRPVFGKRELQSTLSSLETAIETLDLTVNSNTDFMDLEAATRAAETAANVTAITTEQTARIAGDSNLQTTIDGLSTSIGTTIATIQGDITNEVTRATAADTQNASDITDTQMALNDETTRALGAESGLQTQISNLLSNTDGVALNSLAELVADYNAGAATYTAALNAQIATFDAQKVVYDAQIATLQQQVADLTNPPP